MYTGGVFREFSGKLCEKSKELTSLVRNKLEVILEL